MKKSALPELKPAIRSAPANAWLITFADLTSLLVCFFVLIFSTQTMAREGWQSMVGSMRSAFTPQVLAAPVVPNNQNNAMPVSIPKRSIAYLDSIFRQQLATADLPLLVGDSTTHPNGTEEIAYTLPPAWANPTSPETIAAMRQLGGIVRNWPTPVHIRVVVPPGGAWGAASAQAMALAKAAGWTGGQTGLNGKQQGAGAGLSAEVVSGKIAKIQWVILSAE
jgi:hypothetical protein